MTNRIKTNVRTQSRTGESKAKSSPLAYCEACLNIALDQSERVREIYGQIIESLRNPDIQQLFGTLGNALPSSQHRVQEPPGNREVEAQLNDSDTIKQIQGKASSYKDLFRDVLDFRRGQVKSEGVKIWKGLIGELIEEGFNSQEDQSRGIFKITGNSSVFLFSVIHLRALFDFNNFQTPGIGRQTKDFKKPAKHDEVTRVALLWYQCRVTHSSIIAYCEDMKLKKGIEVEPASIDNEIKGCDEAMGYPRTAPGEIGG